MDVGAEAKLIMVQALSKVYSSRNQRGGLSLHRSLLLTLVMKAARDVYHSARLVETQDRQSISPPTAEETQPEKEEPMETEETSLQTACAPPGAQRSPKQDSPVTDKENCNTNGHDGQSRKRRGKLCSEPDFLPCKKAKLDCAEVRRVLLDTAARSNSGQCARETGSHIQPAALIPRTIATC
ncbi:immediate early response gene 2 protein [Trichomycterus rosablanca]|uniref:immediate early response gene 2 protein n=1 Tax=Trichomycterus rosablanca TaxID=2290929 RepID=UPI002F35C925